MIEEQERYFDSSEEPGPSRFESIFRDKDLLFYAKTIQGYANLRNPILSIRGLPAMHTATVFGGILGARKQRRITNILLAVVAGSLVYIAYQLT